MTRRSGRPRPSSLGVALTLVLLTASRAQAAQHQARFDDLPARTAVTRARSVRRRAREARMRPQRAFRHLKAPPALRRARCWPRRGEERDRSPVCDRRRPRRAVTVCALIAMLVMAAGTGLQPTAIASTVKRDLALTYTAAAGERNDLRIDRVAGGYVFTDPGARIVPQAGCASMGPRAVRCTDAGNLGIEVRVGDLDDRVRAHAGVSLTAGGGPGNDVLIGGSGRDGLYGDAGNDRLYGGPGDDVIGPGAGFDLISCGRGREEVVNPGSGDFVEPSCERLTRFVGDGDFDASWRPYPLSVNRSRAVFEVACLVSDFPQPCGGSISLRAVGRRSRLLGRVRFPVRERAARRVAVALTETGRRLASRRGGVIAVVSVAGRNTAASGWRIKFRVSRP